MIDRARKFWSARTKDAMVGLFVVAAGLGLFFMALQVSGLSDFGKSGDTYQIKAHFPNVSGLSDQAEVSMAGVPIGKVTDISLATPTAAATNIDAVVTMEIKNNVNFLTSDAMFSILTAGLLGEKYISVTNGADDTNLKNGAIVDQSQTQGSLMIEDLIQKFATNKMNE